MSAGPAAASGPAAPATAGVRGTISNGVLSVSGTAAADNLALRLRFGDPNTLEVVDRNTNTVVLAFDRSTFTSIDVAAGGGDDTVVIDQTGGVFTDTVPTTLDGGGGNDTLIGGEGGETLLGGGGSDTIDGGRGSDVALMGGGNDTFVWNPGEGSDVVEGEGGTDALQFNGSNAAERIDVSANGSRVLFTRDVAAIAMDLNGIENVNVATLGSADTVTVNDLTGTSTKHVNVDLAAIPGTTTGDGAADNVIVNGTPGVDKISMTSAGGVTTVTGLAPLVSVTGGELANDVLTANGQAGNDVFAMDPSAGAAILARVDGGADDDTVTTTGTAGDDTFTLTSGVTGVFVGNAAGQVYESFSEHLNVKTLGGNDTVIGGNGIGTLTALTIDGGAGDDSLQGGDGNDVIIGGSGNDTIIGGRGSDVALMGGGNDVFVWNPGDQSDTVEGQGGTDSLVFNGSNAAEKIDLSANGSRFRLTRDVAAIAMDVNGVENVNVNVLGSADTVTVNDLSGTNVKGVHIDLASFPGSGTGDGAADAVVVNGTNRVDTIAVDGVGNSADVTGLAATVAVTGAEFANDQLDINTQAGTDKVTSNLQPNVIQLFVDGVAS